MSRDRSERKHRMISASVGQPKSTLMERLVADGSFDGSVIIIDDDARAIDDDIDAMVISDGMALVIDAIAADLHALRELLTPGECRRLRAALVAVVLRELGGERGGSGRQADE